MMKPQHLKIQAASLIIMLALLISACQPSATTPAPETQAPPTQPEPPVEKIKLKFWRYIEENKEEKELRFVVAIFSTYQEKRL